MRPFREDGSFQPGAEGAGEVRRLAVRGAGATMLARAALLAVQIGATVILARLLRPADFGVVAMVSTFSLLLTSFPGFTEAVLQWEEINRFLISNLFWVSVAFGALLTVGFASAGSLLAKFYGDPRVVPIAIVLSFQILLSSSSVLHLALLKRAMCFPAVSLNDFIARVAQVVVAICLAFAGWGYWALVGGFLAFPLSRSIGAWWMCRWIPSLPRRAPGTRDMLRFTANVFGRFNVEYLGHNMDNVLVGWRFGAQPLGFYKKAYDLFALPASLVVRPLMAVAVAALSRFKHDAERYRRYLLRSLTVTAFLGMGLGAVLTLVGKDLIRVLLGPGWAESGRIFVLLGPGIGLMFLYATHSWIHLSIGTADRFFRWGLVEFAVTGLLFIFALRWGPEGIAVAWTLSYGILTIPAFWYAGRPIQLGIRQVVSTFWKYVFASILAACACLAITHSIQPFGATPGLEGALARVITDSILFTLLYLGAVGALHRGFEPVYQVVALLPGMLPFNRTSKPSRVAVPKSGLTGSGTFSMAREEVPESGGR